MREHVPTGAQLLLHIPVPAGNLLLCRYVPARIFLFFLLLFFSCAQPAFTQSNLPTIRPRRVEQPSVAAASGRFEGTAARQHVWLLMIAQQALNNPRGVGVRVKRDVKVASVIARFGFILEF